MGLLQASSLVAALPQRNRDAMAAGCIPIWLNSGGIIFTGPQGHRGDQAIVFRTAERRHRSAVLNSYATAHLAAETRTALRHSQKRAR